MPETAQQQPTTRPHLPMVPFKGILTWSQIVETVATRTMDNFSRTPEVADVYVNYIATHTSKYASVSDCVKVDVLNYPSYVGKQDGLIRAVALENVENEGGVVPPWVLCRNQFPYAAEEGVEHWLVWSAGKEEMPADQVEAILEAEFKGLQYVWFVNELARKTVPEVHHAHVFVNRCAQSTKLK
ncbi:hypothetical protein BDR26DRAFT_917822 [Obelidium mucronatum]|nr:hypothetical protein BDR26DRAFT_917822 [Obelidium mucronatum]